MEQHRADRPWLRAADHAAPESRTVIAAADRGGGHGHIRHEGWVTEEDAMRRAAYLEDPAQLDPAKKHRGIDGLKPGDRAHHCGDLATRITDPDAFATAFARHQLPGRAGRKFRDGRFCGLKISTACQNRTICAGSSNTHHHRLGGSAASSSYGLRWRREWLPAAQAYDA
jgi:hypothetical protein